MTIIHLFRQADFQIIFVKAFSGRISESSDTHTKLQGHLSLTLQVRQYLATFYFFDIELKF